MLSHTLKRYYEPLRLPPRTRATSDQPYTPALPTLHQLRNGPPALHCHSSTTCHPCYPGSSGKRFRSLIYRQRPSPFDHRVGNSKIVTRLHLGSLALRPAVLLLKNSQPLITQTLLSRTIKAYGQLLSRDFNPIE